MLTVEEHNRQKLDAITAEEESAPKVGAGVLCNKCGTEMKHTDGVLFIIRYGYYKITCPICGGLFEKVV